MDAEKPSAFMTDEDWGDEQRRKCAQVDATFAASGAGAVEAEAALDPLGPLLSMLLEEAKILQQHQAGFGIGGDDLGRGKPKAQDMPGNGDEGSRVFRRRCLHHQRWARPAQQPRIAPG